MSNTAFRPLLRAFACATAIIIAAMLWIVPSVVFAEGPSNVAPAAAGDQQSDVPADAGQAGDGQPEGGQSDENPAGGQAGSQPDSGQTGGQTAGGQTGGQPDGQTDGGQASNPLDGQPDGSQNAGQQEAAPAAPSSAEPEAAPLAADSASPAAHDGGRVGPMSVVSPVPKTHTFVFHDGDSIFETVTLKGDETLSEPANPSRLNKRFDGWFADSACTQPFDGFGKSAPALDDGTTHLWAKFADVHYFTYHDEDGSIIEVELVELGDKYKFNRSFPQFELKSDTSRNSGWKDAQGNVYANNELGEQEITIERDLDLYPVPEEGYYVHFHGQGGSATVSQFVHAGGKVVKPADPTREGYDFAGWYDASEGGSAFDFSVAPTPAAGASVEIYAHWNPKEVEYTIAYWLENIESDGHYFKESVTKTGLVGTEPVFDPVSDGKTYKDEIGNVIYFYDADKTGAANQGKTIAADGSTVIDVYYYRFYYLVSLKDLPDANGVKHNYGPIRIKIGQNYSPRIFAMSSDIEGKNFRQLVNGQAGGSTQYWHVGRQNEFAAWTTRIWHSNRTCGTTIEIYPVPKITTYDHGFQVWTERLPGGDPVKQTTYEQTFERAAINDINGPFTASSASIGIGFELYGIPGANGTVQNKTKDIVLEKDNSPYTKNKLYFVRVRNNIEFFGDKKESVADITQVPYEMPLSAYADSVKSYVPGETKYTSANGAAFTFRGWWDNPGFEGDPVSFAEGGTTMPAHGLQLFAKWEEETHTVTFDPNGGVLHDAEVQTLHYGQRAEEPAAPTRHGFRFVDWHVADDSASNGLGDPWHFNSPVNEDIKLRAHWVSETAHTVIYDPGEGSGSVPSVGRYLSGSAAKVQSGDALTPPAHKHFVYWLGPDGERYYPGSVIEIYESDVVLTAIYAPSDLTGLTYDLNYAAHGIDSPVGYETTPGPDSLANNSTIELREPTAEETPAGYRFAGWYLDNACSGDPVTEVLVDAVVRSTPAASTTRGAPAKDAAATRAAPAKRTASAPHNVVYAKWEWVGGEQAAAAGSDDGSTDKPATRPALAKSKAAGTGDPVPFVAVAATALAAFGLSAFADRRRRRKD